MSVADRARRASASARVALFAERLVATARIWSPSKSRPLPRVVADIGPWVPVWLVTAVTAGVAVASAAIVTRGTVPWAIVLATIAITVAQPDGPGAGIFAVTIGVLLVASGTEPFAWPLYVLLATVHLVVVLSALTSGLPRRARFELALLVAPGRRFLAVQAVAQPLALLGALVTGAGVTLPWLPVAAGLGLVVLAWRLDVRVGDDGDG